MKHINLTPLDRVQVVVDDCSNDEQDFFAFLVGQDPVWDALVPGLQKWARAAFGAAGALQQAATLERLDVGGSEIAADADVRAKLLKQEVVSRALEQRIIGVGAGRMWTVKRRVPELLECLVTARLSAPAEDYLYRVAQLYLWEFDEQVFVMARSVLEAALKDALPTAVVYQRLGEIPRKKRHGKRGELEEPTLERRIEAAEAKPPLFDDSVIADMRRIKDDGNVILHTSASQMLTRSESPLTVIRTLVRVLSVVYPT